MAKEIERKYVLSVLPSIDLGIGVRLEQSYVTLAQANVTMRLRLEGEKPCPCFYKGMVSSDEANLDLTDHLEIFDLLLGDTEKGKILKIRYTIADGEGQIEIDVFGRRTLLPQRKDHG